jgi:hypothetical protein
MTRKVEGGCFCGDIRYRISGEPEIQLYCFCKDCRSTTGTDGYAGYMVNDCDFTLTRGAPRTHDKLSAKGRTVKRHFCGHCGSNLWGQTEFGLVSVAAGTLDDPTLFSPTKMTFVHDAPGWARVPDELEEM